MHRARTAARPRCARDLTGRCGAGLGRRPPLHFRERPRTQSRATARPSCSTAAAATRRRRSRCPRPGSPARGSTRAAGDWDLAVFDKRSGAHRRGVGRLRRPRAGRGLRRRRPRARDPGLPPLRRARASASLSAFSVARAGGHRGPSAPRSCACRPRRRATKTLLDTLGLDLTEHGGAGFVEVVAYGAGDLAKLRDAGLRPTRPWSPTSSRRRAATAPPTARSPSASATLRRCRRGRTGYRRLADYEAEMKTLAERRPRASSSRSRCSHKTLEGRDGPRHRDHRATSTSPTASRSSCRWASTTRASGRPASTRWSGRSSSSTATASDARDHRPRQRACARSSCRSSTSTASTSRARRRSTSSRTPRVPADRRPALGSTRRRVPRRPGAFAYKRRNCRVERRPGRAERRVRAAGATAPAASTRTATTAASGAARARAPLPAYDTYRGAGPFSEPETQNVRELVSTPPGDDADHQPHVLQPRAAPAGRPRAGPAAGRGDLQGARRRAWPRRTATRTSRATRSTTRPARPRTGATTRPAASASRSRSARSEFHPPYERTVAEYEGAGATGRQGQPRGLPAWRCENAADASKHSRARPAARPRARSCA